MGWKHCFTLFFLFPAFFATALEKKFYADFSYTTLKASVVLSILSSSFHEDPEGLLRYTGAIILGGLAETTLKTTVPETRPTGSGRSFPSGHAVASFAGAIYTAKRYGWKESLPSLITASATSLFRVWGNRHYYHDILAGALIGTLSAYFITPKFTFSNSRFYIKIAESNREIICGINF